jgi:hypothetical protein
LLDWARANLGDVHLAGSGSTMFLEGHHFTDVTGDVTCPLGALRWYQTLTTPAA